MTAFIVPALEHRTQRCELGQRTQQSLEPRFGMGMHGPYTRHHHFHHPCQCGGVTVDTSVIRGLRAYEPWSTAATAERPCMEPRPQQMLCSHARMTPDQPIKRLATRFGIR